MKKICKRCKNDLDISNFHKDSKSKDNLKASCKKCISLYNKRYNLININKHVLYLKEWQEKNKDHIQKYTINYQNNNKEKIYKKSTEYHKFRYNNDPIFKLRRLLRDRIYKTISKKKVTLKTKELLGCTFEEFRLYIESKFSHEMNWDNHGTLWELDHIKPVSLFNLTDLEQQKQCFHYSNMQPLNKKENRIKSNKYGR
jgi:hypothetical protein